ncbi:lipoprotein [Streptomyces longispororuber]|uniref:Lipoprotein n=2 Tax=Streptomyces longispororuber TaxID=68230 RepID=A0A918Z3X8_9ACTN|nr:lipoprotein [Streptomyces longispororuber]
MTVAGLSSALLAGCGDDGNGSGGGSDKPFAGQSADQIAGKAVAATKQAKSLHIKGDSRQPNGASLTLDLSVDQQKNCDGTVQTQGSRADVRHVGDTFYLRGDEQYWEKSLKGQPGAAKLLPKLKDKWVKVPAEDAVTKGLCDKQGLVKAMDEDKSARKGMRKGDTTTVGGQEAIVLTKKTSAGEKLTLYVATKGEPYILRTTTEGGEKPSSATFSDYDEDVRPQKPAPGETVDLRQLAKS